MQCDLLPFEIDYLSGGGLTLSSRERAMLSTSMAALKRSSNLKNVYFWGKILGQDKDFYIAYGFNTDLLENRQYYRSVDAIKWEVLQETIVVPVAQTSTAHAVEEQKPVKPVVQRDDENNEDEDEEDDEKDDEQAEDSEPEAKENADAKDDGDKEPDVSAKQEVELAKTVKEIDRATSIVPRGAVILTSTGSAIYNRTFEGLSKEEAAFISSYCHLRKERLSNKTTSVDFLDTIETDVPSSQWTIRYDAASGIVLIRNLVYPGFVFYHAPATNRYAQMYIGSGSKNMDFGFTL